MKEERVEKEEIKTKEEDDQRHYRYSLVRRLRSQFSHRI